MRKAVRVVERCGVLGLGPATIVVVVVVVVSVRTMLVPVTGIVGQLRGEVAVVDIRRHRLKDDPAVRGVDVVVFVADGVEERRGHHDVQRQQDQSQRQPADLFPPLDVD